MPVVKWQFHDPELDETYTFEINANKGGSPQYAKKLQYQSTVAPDGQTIAFEGVDDPSQTEFSGTILTRDQYDAMLAWFAKRYPIEFTDDLGRLFSIYITSFAPQRERAAQHPWKHSYTVRYLVLSVTEPAP